ncbi:MAG: non-ribosomal peptide synthetase component F, partial [Phenylobacterium sp.]
MTPQLAEDSLHYCFEMQVNKTPNAIAIVCENLHGEPNQLTYRELDQQANQLAAIITHSYQSQYQQSLSADTLIVVYQDRSIAMVISILAVLKAGAAYVPISPENPTARSQFMLSDTAAPLLLTQDHHVESLNQ